MSDKEKTVPGWLSRIGYTAAGGVIAAAIWAIMSVLPKWVLGVAFVVLLSVLVGYVLEMYLYARKLRASRDDG